MIAGLVYGWRRGWREEALTTGALLVALIMFGERLSDNLGALVNRIVQAFALFFGALFGGDIEARQLITETNESVFRAIGFIVSVFLAYLLGGVLGARRSLGRGGRLMGAVLGLVNVFLVASQVFAYIARFLPSAFQQEGQITLTPDPQATILRGYLPSIFALLLILLLIVVFLRLPKLRE
ncbi:MAG: hypothetical protein AVDCRST_MAG93-5764 [uncultured Chloroflexia bacterium]|uniref:Colicin V production protein n=1 Tax=uncultured Chloroflexia bacterium TaxID=1672391 RepID=A0A6J4L3Q8_9CHLR|nr:MAG: hypothetical protein AVDCRST_MAG93-5764 [uncultured Chloroflexia bacterium]